MTTAKIEKIHEIKPWAGGNGTIYYHTCDMDNGDKISIGKKKQLKEGWELTYEIIPEDGNPTYKKAKPVMPEGKTFNKTTYVPDNQDREKGMRIGHAINNAVQIATTTKGEKVTLADIELYAWKIIELSESMNKDYEAKMNVKTETVEGKENEPADLPF